MCIRLLKRPHCSRKITALFIKDHKRWQHLRHRSGVVACSDHHQFGLPVYLGVDELYLLGIDPVCFEILHQQIDLLGIVAEDEPPFGTQECLDPFDERLYGQMVGIPGDIEMGILTLGHTRVVKGGIGDDEIESLLCLKIGREVTKMGCDIQTVKSKIVSGESKHLLLLVDDMRLYLEVTAQKQRNDPHTASDIEQFPFGLELRDEVVKEDRVTVVAVTGCGLIEKHRHSKQKKYMNFTTF